IVHPRSAAAFASPRSRHGMIILVANPGDPPGTPPCQPCVTPHTLCIGVGHAGSQGHAAFRRAQRCRADQAYELLKSAERTRPRIIASQCPPTHAERSAIADLSASSFEANSARLKYLVVARKLYTLIAH